MKKNKIDWEKVLGSQKDFNDFDFDFEYKLTLMDYLDIYVLYPLRDFNYEVKMKYQILTRGYSDRMVYGFCDYMTDLKLQLLKELKKNKQGHPPRLTGKKWDVVLGQIIEGFEAQVALRDVFTVKEYNKLDKKFKEGMKLYAEHYKNLWD